MHKYVKELLGGSLIYGLSGMITSSIGMFLVPVYTRVFTPAEYGVVSIINTTYFFLLLFIVFGLDNSASLWYWEKKEESERKKTFASWAYFSFGLSVFVATLIWLFSKNLSQLLLRDSSYFELFNLIAVMLVFNSLQKVTNIWFRVRKKPLWAAVYAVFVSLTTISLIIVFVIQLEMGLYGVFLSQSIAAVLTFTLSIVLMFKWFSPKYFDYRRLSELIVFAYPLIPASVFFWLMNSAGSYFIQHYLDKSEIGYYQIGISLAGIIALITSAFRMAWGPFAFSIKDEENHRQTYADVFILFVYVCSMLVFGMFVFAPEVLSIVATPQYVNSAFIAGLLGLNVIVLALPQIVVIGCSLVKTNMPFAKATIIGSIISVILFVLLIPRLGKEGAALATLAGNIFIFLYVYKQAQKLYFIPYKFFTAVIVLTTTVFAALGCLWIVEDYSFGLKLATKSLFTAVCFIFVGYQLLRFSKEKNLI